jgi:hypothetical protein
LFDRRYERATSDRRCAVLRVTALVIPSLGLLLISILGGSGIVRLDGLAAAVAKTPCPIH